MLEDLKTELTIRGFSEHTKQAYINYNQKFIDFIKKKPEDIDTSDIKKYMAYLMSEKGLKPKSMSLVLSALRFFYDDLLGGKMVSPIVRPKIEKKIPDALSKDEVKKLLSVIENPRHRLIVLLMVGSGLRVSEVVSLKVADIDVWSKTLKVRFGKGNKDRMTIVSSAFLGILVRYLKTRKRDSEYLFDTPSGHITVKAAQKVVKDAGKKVGMKKVYCHLLRSTFATQLLEQGVDIRYIQELLGHADLSTTQIYTKVSVEQIKKIKSPFDDIAL